MMEKIFLPFAVVGLLLLLIVLVAELTGMLAIILVAIGLGLFISALIIEIELTLKE